VSAPNGVIVPSGGPLVGQEYFRIQDQDNRIWYWWISYDLAADWSHVPDNPHDQEVRFYLIPYWLKLVDAEGAVYYVSPALDGSPGVSQDPPAIGDGLTGAPALRVRGGKTRYRFDIVGGDIDVVST
jgi:hypothetical protein